MLWITWEFNCFMSFSLFIYFKMSFRNYKSSFVTMMIHDKYHSINRCHDTSISNLYKLRWRLDEFSHFTFIQIWQNYSNLRSETFCCYNMAKFISNWIWKLTWSSKPTKRFISSRLNILEIYITKTDFVNITCDPFLSNHDVVRKTEAPRSKSVYTSRK